MKKHTLITLIVIIFITTIVINAVIFIDRANTTVETIRIDAVVEVGERVAFNLDDSDSMNFGAIRPGYGSTRFISLTNGYEENLTVHVRYRGPSWLYVTENNVLLAPGEQRNITFIAQPPYDQRHGTYRWDITVLFLKT